MENLNIKMFIANKLKELRLKANISQEELAEQLTILKIEREKQLLKENKIAKIDETPITRQTVSKYEIGTLRLNQDILFDLANIFNININEFFPSTSLNKGEFTLPKLSEDELLRLFKQEFKRKGFLDENEEMTKENFDNLIEFAKINKKFIMKDEEKKKK